MVYNISILCNTLDVRRIAYYREPKKKEKPNYIYNQKILKLIKIIFEKSEKRFGSPTIHRELRKKGYIVNIKRVERLMRENNIRAVIGQKKKYKKNNSDCLKNAVNHLNQKFDVKNLNKVWVSDITEIKTREGKSYLCVIMDLCSKKIKSWSISERQTGNLVTRNIIRASKTVKDTEGITFHSDKGCQYTSNEVTKILKVLRIRQSFSGKGNCYDNAPTESFFATLKKEEIYRKNYNTRKELEISVFKYIDMYYNKIRPHSNNGGLSPNEYEKLVS